MHIEAFFDTQTATVTYVAGDSKSLRCAVIDSVHNFDIHSGKLTTQSADSIIDYIKCNQ